MKEEPVRRTYEDAFMKDGRNLGSVRRHRMPSRFQDYDCLLVDSEINEPSTVYERWTVKNLTSGKKP